MRIYTKEEKWLIAEGHMSEAALTISSKNLVLEALFDRGEGIDAAIICHPHPLYGGSMDNNVVSALQKTLQNRGWGTLRFNFRGVGGSTGQHRGAHGDAEDLLTVFQYVQQQGKKNIHLAGYSYGAWIGLRAIKQGLKPNTAILVSPPLDFLDFRDLQPPSCPCLITVGDQDDFCTVDSLRKWASPQPEADHRAFIEILPRCDHFYWNHEKLLSEKITGFLRGDFKSGSA
jgi:uncharacterized protein